MNSDKLYGLAVVSLTEGAKFGAGMRQKWADGHDRCIAGAA